MIKKSSIILLDEATSSLDAETEAKIQEALSILTKNKTTIVMLRMLQIMNWDLIIYVIVQHLLLIQLCNDHFFIVL